jgi:hypothetical protein
VALGLVTQARARVEVQEPLTSGAGVTECRADEEGSSMRDQREEERKREDEERLRVAKERRGAELREAWREHHPSESEIDEKRPPKKRPPA